MNTQFLSYLDTVSKNLNNENYPVNQHKALFNFPNAQRMTE